MEEFQTDVRGALTSQDGKIEDVRVEARQAAEAQHTRLEHVEKYQVLQALAAIRKQQNLHKAVTLTLRVREQPDIAIEDQLPWMLPRSLQTTTTWRCETGPKPSLMAQC